MSFQLLPYSHDWPMRFEALRCRLEAAFAEAGVAVAIEHIGSTAVPGLCAKPVIDVLAGAASLAAIESAVPSLVAAGFVYVDRYEAEIPDRRYFVRSEPGALRVHVHAVCQAGRLWQAHLAFRDALRTDARLREDYACLKQQLAQRHAGDKAAYAEAKGPFIRHWLAAQLPS